MKGGKTKTVWIVDGAYLFKSAASHGRFDYLQLKIELQKEVEAMFSESYYFNSQGSSTSQAQEGFNKWLRSAAPSGPQMTTKFRKLRTTRQRCPSCGELFEREMQMGVDTDIVVTICKLTFQNRLDTLVLCAGDGDFEAALEHVREAGREIAVAAFRETCSTNLQHLANRVIWLEDLWERIKKDSPTQEGDSASSAPAAPDSQPATKISYNRGY